MSAAFGCRVRLRHFRNTERRNRINPATARASRLFVFGCAVRLCLYPKRGRGKDVRYPRPNHLEPPKHMTSLHGCAAILWAHRKSTSERG